MSEGLKAEVTLTEHERLRLAADVIEWVRCHTRLNGGRCVRDGGHNGDCFTVEPQEATP